MRSQSVPLRRIERPLQQRAKNGRLHVLPFRLRRLRQQLELPLVHRQRFDVLKKSTVKAQHPLFENRRKAANVHGSPQALHHRHKLRGLILQSAQQLGPAILRQQMNVLGKARENAAHQKASHSLGLKLFFEVFRQLRQSPGDLAGHSRTNQGRIERKRIKPNLRQPLPDLVVFQIAQKNAMCLRVGERHIRLARQ